MHVERVSDDLAESESEQPAVRRQHAAGKGTDVQMLKNVQSHQILRALDGICGWVKDEVFVQKIQYSREIGGSNGIETPVRMIAAELAHLVTLPAEPPSGHGDERFRPVQIVRVIPLEGHRASGKHLLEHRDVGLGNGGEAHGPAALVFLHQPFDGGGMIPADGESIVRGLGVIMQADEKRISVGTVFHAAEFPPHQKASGGGITLAPGKKRQEGPEAVRILPRQFPKKHQITLKNRNDCE